MSTDTFTVSTATLPIFTMRRRILRVHGIMLLVVALITAIYSTVARYTGWGVYGFLQQEPLVWTGLIQAYLLMAIIAMLLWIGAGEAKIRRWDVVGAIAHLPPVIAVIFSWHAIQAAGFGAVAIGSLTFHTIWIMIEIIIARYPDVPQ